MVSVEGSDAVQIQVASYHDWNSALARAFFSPNRAGELVYLDKDDDAFAAACADVGVHAERADASLAQAVRDKLCWKESGRATFANFDLMTKSWVAKRRKAFRDSVQVPPPPHVALLALFSLAAERMGGANMDTGAAESSYYSSLEGLLTVPPAESGRFRVSFTRSSEAYWESLSLWLEDQDGQRGMPSAYALMHRYVGLPISQALVRERERRNLTKMFEEQGFVPGTTVSHLDMYGAIDVWITSARTSANTALRKMWASTEIKNRIVEIALAEFASWEGAASVGGAHPVQGQKSQRCLLTVRDSRVALRSEMRFGLLVGASGSPGDQCRIEGLGGADREFPLEFIGAGSAGFDFRAVGVDVGSAVSGDLHISLGSSQTLRRFPKNVVILTQDAFSAGYIESDRINAAVPSRILVRHEPKLIAAVEKILVDSAQPGYATVSGGTGGVPQGWTVFTNVVLLRVPMADLVAGTDLSAFQPRLSTQMTIKGGLKLPGHMPRWSALSPIHVVIASDSDDPVDLVVLTRDTETLQTEERVIQRGLAVPAVVNLDDVADWADDFTLSLRRGKTTLQTMTVKLRSSREPSPDSSKRFRSLCHDLENPLWPIQSVPSEDAETPGVDGVAVSAPEMHHAVRSVAARPNWNGVGGIRPKEQPLVVAGPAHDSCIVTGHHRFDFPTFDGKRPKSRWMYGVCLQCGMSKRQPTWVPNGQLPRDVSTPVRRQILPSLSPVETHWCALIDVLYYLGAGSRRDFSVLARQLEDSAIFESKLLNDLEALGVIELERNADLEVVQWESAASCIGELADGTWLLTGYWDRRLSDAVLDKCKDLGASVTVVAPQRQSMHVIAEISHDAIAAIAEKFDVDLVPDVAQAIARALPPLSIVGAGLSRRSMPFAASYEYFDTHSASWMDLETAVLPGLYRVSQSFSSRYYYRNAEDVAEGVAAIVTVELGKHLAALDANRPLLAYDPVAATLSVPIGAELPGLYGRAAVMGDGNLPEIRRSDRSTNYFNVPPEAAEALIGKLTS